MKCENKFISIQIYKVTLVDYIHQEENKLKAGMKNTNTNARRRTEKDKAIGTFKLKQRRKQIVTDMNQTKKK